MKSVNLLTIIFCLCSTVGHTQVKECNAHCAFSHLGYEGCKNLPGFNLETSFPTLPFHTLAREEAFPEYRNLRELHKKLCLLEHSVSQRDWVQMTNAVESLAQWIGNLDKKLPMYDGGLEMIAYSLTRLLQSKHHVIFDETTLDRLMPGYLLSGEWRSNKDLLTFKHMLISAGYIEKFRLRYGRLPMSFEEAGAPESAHKCSYGQDIEYLTNASIWVLRCKCRCKCGSMPFDTYLPSIRRMSECLPLILSSTFSEKRREMFSGEWIFLIDDYSTFRVNHSPKESQRGRHGIEFKMQTEKLIQVAP